MLQNLSPIFIYSSQQIWLILPLFVDMGVFLSLCWKQGYGSGSGCWNMEGFGSSFQNMVGSGSESCLKSRFCIFYCLGGRIQIRVEPSSGSTTGSGSTTLVESLNCHFGVKHVTGQKRRNKKTIRRKIEQFWNQK